MTFLSNEKLLVANRGEICLRICRAARELSIPTIALYSYEDRYSDHHQAANESYQIAPAGQVGPREAYLDKERILAIAKENGATMIHPGYGFLSEDSSFARAVEEAGITFVGPSATALETFGDKIAARKVAIECGVPTIPGFDRPILESSEIEEFISKHGFPVIIKASHGGGGRGQRILSGHRSEDIAAILQEARSEARDSFGVDSVFVEKFLPSPKHIEVQILADKQGNVIHLLERDCTIQRRHQKIIELAPAISVSTTLRQQMQAAAVLLAKHVKYENAATVEFLVQDDHFYFIEVNPRIQVEHTVTEEILDIDLVQAQIRIARDASLCEFANEYVNATPIARGLAIQCRVTSEMPWMGFAPSCGIIAHCQLPSGPGVRVDGYNLFPGAEITPHYDPLWLKCIVHANDLDSATAKMLAVLSTSYVDGIETNLGLLQRILQDSRFQTQAFFTRSLDNDVHLSKVKETSWDNTHQKLLSFFAETLINGTQIQGQVGSPESLHELELPIIQDNPHPGWRNVLLAEGPKTFASKIRQHPHILVSDTTWRDAQQSILATRVRTVDLANIAPYTDIAYRRAYSLECWGGATFDVALRFLHEDPWKRLASGDALTLRRLVPNVPFQMLLRSVSGLAYSAVPHNFLEFFTAQAVKNGMDIIRVFDGLNDLSNLSVAINACLKAGAVVEAAILYTGDMLDPGCKYSLSYYLNLIDGLVVTGAHILAIKSMSGVMKPEAARRLVAAVRSRYPDIPIHVHTHDAAGTGVATMLACVEAGADVIDGATDSLSGTTSQPAMSALLASLMGRISEPEVRIDDVRAIDSYWSQLRLLYAGFDAKLSGPDPDVYLHEIPGGQLTNLMFQARELGLGSQWKETKAAFVAANRLLGDIIKATPTSKAVGDLAQFMVNSHLNYDDVLARADSLNFPDSVLDYFEGLMGQPFDGFPEPLRTQVLTRAGRARIAGQASAQLSPTDIEHEWQRLKVKHGDSITETDVCSYVMFPDVFTQYREYLARFGDIDLIPTQHVLAPLKAGEEIACPLAGGGLVRVQLLALQPRPEGEDAPTERTAFFRANGEYRQATVHDLSLKNQSKRRQADPGVQNQMGSPFSGIVSAVFKDVNTHVFQDEVVLAISAMKMIINVSAPCDGFLRCLDIEVGGAVEKGDLLFELSK
ncbi:pyruvate carboxylase [Xylariaceae sp. AK1471]|nr:pyruvate carboxylase [Xylariaceae sp. AK1471]